MAYYFNGVEFGRPIAHEVKLSARERAALLASPAVTGPIAGTGRIWGPDSPWRRAKWTGSEWVPTDESVGMQVYPVAVRDLHLGEED